MIKRAVDLESYVQPNKAVIVLGARRVGKTTLLQNFLKNTTFKYKFVSGDDLFVGQILSSHYFDKIIPFVEGYELFVIDEAQMVPGIGLALKIIVDQVPGIRVIATGSSSFDLMQNVGEPLLGRKWTVKLYPLSQTELSSDLNTYETKQKLEEYMIFGGYPEVITKTNRSQKIKILEETVGSYLMKDLLRLNLEKGSETLLNLLKLLAFQIGSEVSLNELATTLGIAVRTVERYLYLLEEAFIIIRLGSFSRNLRSEITQKAKYYFVDNGIRNAVISQFNSFENRNDHGQLWENFIFIERWKKRIYHNFYANTYFWRNYNKDEVDLIEEYGGNLYGYEFKWGHRKVKPPKIWLDTYDNASYEVVDQSNYLEFVK